MAGEAWNGRMEQNTRGTGRWDMPKDKESFFMWREMSTLASGG